MSNPEIFSGIQDRNLTGLDMTGLDLTGAKFNKKY